MIPGEWFPRKLGDVTTWRSGGTPPMSNKSFWNGDIPWISASTMYSNAFDTSTKFISAEGLKTGSKLASPNDLLLLVRGSMLWNRIPIGIAKTDLAFNQDVKSITVDSSLRPNFLLFWFLANENKLLHMVTGTGIGAGKLDTKELQAIRIEVPPLPEQKKITQILSAWDKAIETVEKLIENSQQKKKALMQQLLTGKKRFPEFDGEWKEVLLENVAKIVMGSSPSSKAYNDKGIGLPLIQGNADIKKRKSAPRLFTTEITKECDAGDILLSVRAPVGEVSISTHHACIGRGIASIKSKNPQQHDFLYQWLLWHEPRWASLSQGSTFSAVNGNDIRNMPLLLPSNIVEQQKIASVLSSADREIETWQQELAHLKQEKKALMQQLLTGKRRVKVN